MCLLQLVCFGQNLGEVLAGHCAVGSRADLGQLDQLFLQEADDGPATFPDLDMSLQGNRGYRGVGEL